LEINAESLDHARRTVGAVVVVHWPSTAEARRSMLLVSPGFGSDPGIPEHRTVGSARKKGRRPVEDDRRCSGEAMS